MLMIIYIQTEATLNKYVMQLYFKSRVIKYRYVLNFMVVHVIICMIR